MSYGSCFELIRLALTQDYHNQDNSKALIHTTLGIDDIIVKIKEYKHLIDHD